MAQIDVERIDDGEPTVFHVRVTDDDGSSADFHVTLTSPDRERLASGYLSTEAFVAACFEFLLEREPTESILRSFDVSVISRYFPEFAEQIRRPNG